MDRACPAEEPRWSGSRSVRCTSSAEGLNVFEERIVAFEADTPEAAHAKARKESAEYAAFADFVVHPMQVGYRQDGDPLIDGYELWSILYESPLTLEEFYAEHYDRYEYRGKGGPRP